MNKPTFGISELEIMELRTSTALILRSFGAKLNKFMMLQFWSFLDRHKVLRKKNIP